MIHRHLQVRPETPAEELPLAAVADLLERGDLEDWRPLAEVVRRDPLGGLAEGIARLIDANPSYGTSPLWRSWIDRCRIRAAGAAEPHQVAGLGQLRRELGLTQAQLAPRVGVSQSDLSKLERRRDVRVSSLRSYARALGGRLRILFDLPGGQFEVRQHPDPGPGSRRKPMTDRAALRTGR